MAVGFLVGSVEMSGRGGITGVLGVVTAADVGVGEVEVTVLVFGGVGVCDCGRFFLKRFLWRRRS